MWKNISLKNNNNNNNNNNRTRLLLDTEISGDKSVMKKEAN